MNQSFSPGLTFNGMAYTSSLTLNNLVLYDQTSPFQIYQGSTLIFTFGPGVLEVNGDLTVSGTLTTNTTIINTYASGLIHLADANPADNVDIGIYGEYVNGATVYTGLARDSSDARRPWALFNNYLSNPTTKIDGGTPIGDANLDNLKVLSIATPSGTALAPSYTFTSVYNSGMYYVSNTIGFSILGVAKLFISGTSIVTPNILTISSTADAASSSDLTASISTAGGLAVAKKIYSPNAVIGDIVATTATIATLTSTTSNITTANTVTLAVSSSLTSPSVSCTNLTVSGSASVVNLSVSGTFTIGSVAFTTISGTSLTLTNDATIAGTVTSGALITGDSSITGTLTVVTAGPNFIGGATTVQGLTASTLVSNTVRATSVSTSSSPTDATASLSTAGGLSVAANANFGTNVLISGNLIVLGSTIATEGTNKITGVETGTTVSLNTTKCAIECTNVGAVVVNLPAFTGTYKGKEFYIISTSGSITIAPNGADLLNGVNASLVLSGAPRAKVYILGVEAGWWTF